MREVTRKYLNGRQILNDYINDIDDNVGTDKSNDKLIYDNMSSVPQNDQNFTSSHNSFSINELLDESLSPKRGPGEYPERTFNLDMRVVMRTIRNSSFIKIKLWKS
jgi:hypothetical protein